MRHCFLPLKIATWHKCAHLHPAHNACAWMQCPIFTESTTTPRRCSATAHAQVPLPSLLFYHSQQYYCRMFMDTSARLHRAECRDCNNQLIFLLGGMTRLEIICVVFLEEYSRIPLFSPERSWMLDTQSRPKTCLIPALSKIFYLKYFEKCPDMSEKFTDTEVNPIGDVKNILSKIFCFRRYFSKYSPSSKYFEAVQFSV